MGGWLRAPRGWIGGWQRGRACRSEDRPGHELVVSERGTFKDIYELVLHISPDVRRTNAPASAQASNPNPNRDIRETDVSVLIRARVHDDGALAVVVVVVVVWDTPGTTLLCSE